jgi:hypothetical protein
VFVLTEEQRAELRAINREWLLTSPIEEHSDARSAPPEPQGLTNGETPEPTP